MKTRLIAVGLLATFATGMAVAANKETSSTSEAEKTFRNSFRSDNPGYWMKRLDQDETMALCSKYKNVPPKNVKLKIERDQMATIRYPVEGKLIGDWREGEKLASSGKGGHIGFIQPDPPGTARGGNCYACHQMSPKEVAYGTIGPSLKHFAKTRGNSEEIVKYVYDKVYNSNAFTACTNMPRIGYNNWLTPEQITHIVAYVLDPESPVNQE